MPCTNSAKSLQAILEIYLSSYYGATTTDYLLVAEVQLEDHQIGWVNTPPPPTYIYILICHDITEITLYRCMEEAFGGKAECMEQSGLTSQTLYGRKARSCHRFDSIQVQLCLVSFK